MIVNLTTFLCFISMVITQEVSNSVDDCPLRCNCKLINEIICNKGNLSEILIRHFPPFLIKLSLSKNTIPVVRQNTFEKLKNLVDLNLDDNNISRVEHFAFKGLNKLRKLSIQRTSLSTLEKFAFSGLQNMSFILLAHNRIRSVQPSAFAGSSNIRLILLYDNPIHVIQSRAFAGLRNVEFLILASGIKVIERDAFNTLDSVGLLKLPLMDLKCMEAFTFRGLSHVHVLAIRESDLGVVRPKVFAGLVNVTSLVLLRNKIDHLEELRINVTNKIKSLRLEGNHMLQIPTPGSVQVQVLENFTVVDNHFPCDCRVHTLLASPLATETGRNFTAKNYCISPLEMNGKPISDVDVENVGRCSNEYRLDSWNIGASVRRKLIPLHGWCALLAVAVWCC